VLHDLQKLESLHHYNSHIGTCETTNYTVDLDKHIC
ncbi:unnamed protein product, partial [Callosobruchus maculatus]